jgi:hypothetical protein
LGIKIIVTSGKPKFTDGVQVEEEIRGTLLVNSVTMVFVVPEN